MKHINWHFRRNKKRKLGNSNKGAHPSLVIGETDDGKSYVNLGLTNNPKRGHHKNVPIHNPQDWSKTAYVRDDIRTDSKQYLEVILTDYKLCPEDIDKIWEIIKKKNPLRAIAELPRWVLHILNQKTFLFTSSILF